MIAEHHRITRCRKLNMFHEHLRLLLVMFYKNENCFEEWAIYYAYSSNQWLQKWLLSRTTVLSPIAIAEGFLRSGQVTPLVTMLFTIDLSVANCRMIATSANLRPNVISFFYYAFTVFTIMLVTYWCYFSLVLGIRNSLCS